MIQIPTIQISPLLPPGFSACLLNLYAIHQRKTIITPSETFKSQRYDIENRILRYRHGRWSLQTDGGNHHLRLQPSLCQVGPTLPPLLRRTR
jgi:hypothetical protein